MIMDRYTAGTLASTTAARWRKQFKPEWSPPRARRIQAALDALGSRPTADQVERAIGNRLWTTAVCSLCNQLHRSGVLMGGAEVCDDCIFNAYELIRA